MASSSIVSYMFGAGELEMPQPQEVIQKGTAYF